MAMTKLRKAWLAPGVTTTSCCERGQRGTRSRSLACLLRATPRSVPPRRRHRCAVLLVARVNAATGLHPCCDDAAYHCMLAASQRLLPGARFA